MAGEKTSKGILHEVHDALDRSVDRKGVLQTNFDDVEQEIKDRDRDVQLQDDRVELKLKAMREQIDDIKTDIVSIHEHIKQVAIVLQQVTTKDELNALNDRVMEWNVDKFVRRETLQRLIKNEIERTT